MKTEYLTQSPTHKKCLIVFEAVNLNCLLELFIHLFTCFSDRVSYIPGLPLTPDVAKADTKLILMILPTEAGIMHIYLCVF